MENIILLKKKNRKVDSTKQKTKVANYIYMQSPFTKLNKRNPSILCSAAVFQMVSDSMQPPSERRAEKCIGDDWNCSSISRGELVAVPSVEEGWRKGIIVVEARRQRTSKTGMGFESVQVPWVIWHCRRKRRNRGRVPKPSLLDVDRYPAPMRSLRAMGRITASLLLGKHFAPKEGSSR